MYENYRVKLQQTENTAQLLTSPRAMSSYSDLTFYVLF